METAPPSIEPHASGGKDFPIIRWTFLSTALFIVALGTNEGFRWSNFWSGFETAVFLLLFFLIPTLILFVLAWIWNLLCLRIVRPHRHPRLVRIAMLIPAFGLLTYSVITRPTSPELFEQITGVAFPENYSEAFFSHVGGGLTDHSHIFAFTTSPEETERLIQELNLRPSDSLSHAGFDQILANYPGGKIYYRSDTGRNWYYDLITDETRTKVWIHLYGI